MVVDPNIACNIMISIGKLDAKENFSDFTVVVEGREFRCHRFLLNACSGFFNALLRSGMKEASESSVVVHGISSETFSTILECLYKGANVITRSNVIDLWHAANLLQIQFLITECEKYVIDKLIPEDKQDVYAHAKLLDSSAVLKSLLNLIAKDFEKFSNSSIFLQLYPEDIQSLIQHEELEVSSEDVVVNAILRWASHSNVLEENQPVPLSDNSSKSATPEQEKRCTPTEILSNSENIGVQTDMLVPASKEFEDENIAAMSMSELSCSEKDVTTSEKRINRQEYLGQLLSACRICLVSTDCVEMLLSMDIVLENKQALLAIRKAILYHFKPGPWSSLAIHRPTSPMENVILFVEKNFLKAYSVYKNKTFYISELPEGAESCATLSIINNQIFLLIQNQKGRFYSSLTSLFIFTSPNCWSQVLENTIFQHNFALLNNFIYWITDSKICRINTNLMLYDESIPAEIVLPLSVERIFIVKNTLAFGHKILFLCSEDQLTNFSVICLDTHNLKVSRHVLEGHSGHIVSFRDECSTFLLFQDGTLQKVVDCPDGGVIFRFLTKLWGFMWDVRGAVVFEKQLYLFGNLHKIVDLLNVQVIPGQALVYDAEVMKSLKVQWPWSANLPGYFDKIHVIFVDGRSQFLPFVVPKKWMDEKPSI
ncbi:kelch-like protein 7 [Biomphalaria pfeifferi]|uniref:Kelch-like protein 7 n=1 Tax=Biomphalaria pfeifferi TaxID=112525 RepID=A0AAD8EWF9_BIOPF|nr:kelch-like protein 7 [Biomphalaria pfeifferi]